MNKIGLYLRVSSEEQARIVEGSLVSQRLRLEEYVESQNRRQAGWGMIIDVYCDEAKSGKDMNRPQFQRLLADIRAGRINLILATELSRLSRSNRDFCEMWDMFKAHNAAFVTLREQFDTTTAAGEMMVFNLINFAQYERKQTAERISANWASRAKRGLWNGGTIPMGYDRNPANKGVLIVNEEEAKQVRAIFDTFLEVGSLRQTCLKLTEMGIRSKRYVNKAGAEKGGGHFTIPTLNTMLKNRALIGLREIGKKKGCREVVPAAWPAIIDTDTFEKVQAKLQGNKSRYKPDEWKTYPYPLTQMLVCGECGKSLGGKSAHGKLKTHFYYAHCRNLKSDGLNHKKRCRLERVQAARIEDIVLKSLKSVVESPEKFDDMIRAYRTQTTGELPGIEGRLKAISSDIKTTERRLENLTLRLADLPPEVAAGPIYDQMRVMNEKVAEQKSVKTRLEAQLSQVTANDIDVDGLRARLTEAVGRLESAPVEKQRPIIENVLKFAEIYPTRIRFGLYAPALQTKNPQGAAKEGGPAGGQLISISNFMGDRNAAGSTSVINGGLGRNRTVDTRLFRALLYRLSYQATSRVLIWYAIFVQKATLFCCDGVLFLERRAMRLP